jgi:hypothetical protein
MNKIEDQEPATLDELTTEQKERTDPDYIAAVNRGVARAVKEMEDGKGIPDDEFWKEFGL